MIFGWNTDAIPRVADTWSRRVNRVLRPRGPKPEEPHPIWTDPQHFYNNVYFFRRQRWYRAHDTWFTIANRMWPKPVGRLCEYGCGIAPVSAWVARYFPQWEYTLIDVPSPQYAYAKSRMSPYQMDTTLDGGYDVVVALEVLEHLEDPFHALHDLIAHLLPGGSLFVNYIDTYAHEADLMRDRAACLTYLNHTLRLVSDGDYWHYRK